MRERPSVTPNWNDFLVKLISEFVPSSKPVRFASVQNVRLFPKLRIDSKPDGHKAKDGKARPVVGGRAKFAKNSYDFVSRADFAERSLTKPQNTPSDNRPVLFDYGKLPRRSSGQ